MALKAKDLLYKYLGFGTGAEEAVKNSLNKKHLYLMALFTIFLFEFMMTQIYLDSRFYAEETGPWGFRLHYIMTAVMALGFVSFSLSRRFTKSIAVRRLVLIATYGLYFAGAVTSFVTDSLSVLAVAGCLTGCCLSMLGGAIYYYVAEGLVNHPAMGRLMGICSALAVFIQIAVHQILTPVSFLFVILFGFGLSVIGSLQLDNEWMFDEPLEYAGKNDGKKLAGNKEVLIRVLITAMIYILVGVTDKICVAVTASGNPVMYNWPRLGLGLSYLVIGFFADLSHKRYLYLITICTILPIICIPMVMNAGYYAPAMFAYYFLVGSQILCISLIFWELAPRTAFPYLTASLGRATNACVEILFLLPFTSDFVWGTVLETAMIMGLLLILSLSGLLPVSNALVVKPDRMGLFIERFALTPREKDILSDLLKNDDNMNKVAERVGVSERAAYRHLNNIYQKTGTTSRLQLMRLFYENPEEKG
ncbi:MAG: helix-turn-helix transcriptional regulator [Lachnospiraceae bacterium]|nr:helix-turn-helix transcriptional regulator [Lachnospiraceae bacterium]